MSFVFDNDGSEVRAMLISGDVHLSGIDLGRMPQDRFFSELSGFANSNNVVSILLNSSQHVSTPFRPLNNYRLPAERVSRAVDADQLVDRHLPRRQLY
jgi:hypothetical protein